MFLALSIGVDMKTVKFSSPLALTVTSTLKSECVFAYDKAKFSALKHNISNVFPPKLKP